MHPQSETDRAGSPPAGLPAAVDAARGRHAGFIAVIPAFNEVATIRGVVDHALHEVERVIVVDDGSTDGTPKRSRAATRRSFAIPSTWGKRRACGAAWRALGATARKP